MVYFRPSSRRSLLVLAMSIAFAFGLGRVAHAQSADSRADEALAKGQRLFQDGKYTEAIEQLRTGYVVSPQPRFLYALGQAYRLNHQCKEAVKAYRDFIRSEPSHSQIASTESNIQRCGEEDPSSLIEEPVKPTPDPKANVVVIPPVENVLVAAPPRTPTYKKWWPWTILGVAVVGVGLGVGLGLGLHHTGNSFNPTLPDVGPNASH
jgi:tetratricopeptide (TPR) repeat protein